jgi:N6-adenosine-specific RNA methylase IME4
MAKKPVTLWAFADGEATIRPDGLVVGGAPTEAEWADLGPKLGKLRGGVQWAIGDWLLYGEERSFSTDAYEAAAEATGLKRVTLINLKSVAKAFPKAARAVEVSWSHYALCAGFDDEQRGELLRKAQAENLSWEELRGLCQQERHQKAREWQKFPDGTFGVIVATPPWQKAPYEDNDTTKSMNEHEIGGLAPAVQGIAAPGCVLYLTAKSFRLEEAFEVMKVWGFSYVTHHVIMRETLGAGVWNRERHDLVLVGTRGVPVPPAEDDRFDSLLTEGELLDRIERAFDHVPRVLLFDRGMEREGWSCWGERLDGMTANAPARALRVRPEVDVVPS